MTFEEYRKAIDSVPALWGRDRRRKDFYCKIGTEFVSLNLLENNITLRSGSSDQKKMKYWIDDYAVKLSNT